MKLRTFSVAAAALSFSFLSTGCEEKAKDAASALAGISAAFNTVYSSGCLVDSESITGANRVKLFFALGTDGSFNYVETWYTGGSCSPVNYAFVHTSGGTFSIADASQSQATVNFVVQTGDLMAMSTAVQTSFNTDCGGTSPYHSNVNSSNNGVHKNTYGTMTCMNKTFPTSAHKNYSNIVAYENGQLKIGVPEDLVPGIYTGGTVPTTATIVLTAQ